jgi:hypothetical protein
VCHDTRPARLLGRFSHLDRQGVKQKTKYFPHLVRHGVIFAMMNPETLRTVMSELGKKGGPARAKSLTAKERKAIATKASKAAAKARSAKAAQRDRRSK